MEVAAIVNKYDQVLDSNVYGVEVKSAEGRAGIALLSVTDEFNFNEFSEHIEKFKCFSTSIFLENNGNDENNWNF